MMLLHDKVLGYPYIIVCVVKLQRLQWTGNVVHMTEASHSRTSLAESSLGKRLPEDQKGEGRIL
jgi:hypothetical protein